MVTVVIVVVFGGFLLLLLLLLFVFLLFSFVFCSTILEPDFDLQFEKRMVRVRKCADCIIYTYFKGSRWYFGT